MRLKGLSTRPVSKAFVALASGISIKAKGISLHSLRHFGTTEALVGGTDIGQLPHLGHADAALAVRVYSHVVPGAQEKAVAGIGDAIVAAQIRRTAGDPR
jgi:site-specific recombinase XerD